jgi:hypothetical protein
MPCTQPARSRRSSCARWPARLPFHSMDNIFIATHRVRFCISAGAGAGRETAEMEMRAANLALAAGPAALRCATWIGFFFWEFKADALAARAIDSPLLLGQSQSSSLSRPQHQRRPVFLILPTPHQSTTLVTLLTCCPFS